jgi:hypothetical protein
VYGEIDQPAAHKLFDILKAQQYFEPGSKDYRKHTEYAEAGAFLKQL